MVCKWYVNLVEKFTAMILWLWLDGFMVCIPTFVLGLLVTETE